MRDTPETPMERIAAELRRPMSLGRAFDAKVMAAVRALPRHRLGTWARLLRPRTIRVSPLVSGLAAAALFAVAMSTGHAIGAGGGDSATGDGRGDAASGGSARTAGSSVAGRRDVQFVLVAPTARKVAVVGDFNDWDSSHSAYQAQHRGGGVWSVTAPIPPGHHRYSFVVDDSVWVTDPTAPRGMDDEYGVPNSALVVGDIGK